MSQLMHFGGNGVRVTYLLMSIFSLIFLVYALVCAKKFVGFYKKKFYVVFLIHYYALWMNCVHELIMRHEILHATVATEVSMLILMLFFLGLTVFWTYRFYLRFVYSLISKSHFKGVRQLIHRLLVCCKLRQRRDYYDYHTLSTKDDSFEDEGGDETQISESNNEIMIDGWFKYMNYQILGNYLFSQMFVLYSLTGSYFTRLFAIMTDINGTGQLMLQCMLMGCFVLVLTIFDFRYRKFTKSLIMPHLSLMQLVGCWMYEHYHRFYRRKPEVSSTLTFIGLFMYIVIKFSFLTEISTIEKYRKKHT